MANNNGFVNLLNDSESVTLESSDQDCDTCDSCDSRGPDCDYNQPDDD